jgi:selenocysteine-specific translation elongation factor
MEYQKEDNFIIGILGENYPQRKLIGQALGSPDTKSDIEIFGRLDSTLGQVFCALTPIEYPEKIKPFLQVLKITKIHLLVIDIETGLNAAIGEILVSMDIMHQLYNTKALIVIAGINSKTEWKIPKLEKALNDIISTTSLKKIDFIEIREKEDYQILKRKIVEIGKNVNDTENHEYLKILIDHSFPVKGIGTVILGIVDRGKVTSGQMVEITGYEGPPKKAIIRNIQKHDRNFKEAYRGDRVGIALKGNISPSDINRDNIITSQGIFKQNREIKATVYINPFYKPKNGVIHPGNGSQFHGIVEIKSSPFKFIEGDDLIPGKKGVVSMRFDRNLVHDGSGLRGLITEMNKFEDKLRIVGWFEELKDYQ